MPGKFSITSVTSITQDPFGIIWFGTRNGVFKYNGVEIVSADYINSYLDTMTCKDVYSIHFDQSGVLWIGTISGLNVYDPAKGKIETVRYCDKYSLGTVYCIEETYSGKILFGSNTGLYRYNKNLESVELTAFRSVNNKKLYPKGRVLSVCESRNGYIWVGTKNGLYQLNDLETDDNVIAYYNRDNKGKNIRSNHINVLEEDSYGNVWIGTDKGLCFYSNDTIKRVDIHSERQYDSNHIRALALDYNKRLWVGTKNGIAIIDSSLNVNYISRSEKQSNNITDNKIRSLFTDKNGYVWVGSYYGGVDYWTSDNHVFKHIDKSLFSDFKYPVVNEIAQDKKGVFYYACENEGVVVFNDSINSFNYIKKTSAGDDIGTAKSLYVDDSLLWIGTYRNGLISYNLNTGKCIQFTDDVLKNEKYRYNAILKIEKYSNNIFFLGTLKSGLLMFNTQMESFQQFSAGYLDSTTLVTTSPRALLVDSNKNVWAGGNGGICVLLKSAIHTKSYKFRRIHFPSEQKLIVNTIFEDSNGQVWVGTINESLFKVIDYELVSVDLGNSNTIFSINEDKQKNLWVSSNVGVLKYKLETGCYTLFDHENDLVPNEFIENSMLIDNKGNLYIGGASGITVIDVSKLTDEYLSRHQISMKPVITEFRVYDDALKIGAEKGKLSKAIEYTSDITLDHDQNVFSIKFVTPNYIKTKKNKYQYRLVGFNDKWIDTYHNIASYTLQKGGEYYFEVRNASTNGNSDLLTRMKITIVPPFYKSVVAFVLYLFMALGVIITIFLIIQSRTHLKHKLEIEETERKSQQKVYEQKMNFFINVSHDYRTPLTLIISSLQNFIDEFDGSSNELRKLFAIQRNGNRLLHMINELLDFQKIEKKQMSLKVVNADIVSFIKEIYLSFKPHAETFNYKYDFQSDADLLMVWFDKDKLERVFYNLISNAFNYTHKGGKVMVEIVNDINDVKISVIDRGKGISKNKLDYIVKMFSNMDNRKLLNIKAGMGLTIVKNIIMLHRARIEVDSEYGKGSVFTVVLPKGNVHFSENEIYTSASNDEVVEFIDEEEKDSFNYKLDIENITDINDKEYTILVAEDNAEVSLLIKQCLNAYYNIIITSDGQEALKKVNSVMPDLIISDVMMPNLNGVEFCKEIKTNIETSHIPFIILTARSSLIHRFDGLESGADEYISKPFHVKELVLKCQNILKTRERIRAKFQNAVLMPGELFSQKGIDDGFLRNVVQIIEKNIGNELFGMQDICEELAMGRTVFYSKVKALTGRSPNELLVKIRLKYAAGLIVDDRFNISEVASMVGYKNPNYFSQTFKKHYGITPKEYKKKFTH